jgi:hypothetical protein
MVWFSFNHMLTKHPSGIFAQLVNAWGLDICPPNILDLANSCFNCGDRIFTRTVRSCCWYPSLLVIKDGVPTGAFFYQTVNETRCYLYAKCCGSPYPREVFYFILTRLGTGISWCIVWLSKNCAVTLSYYWQNLHFVKFVGNFVSSTTWNMNLKVESLPEMCRVSGILQTLDNAHCWEEGNLVPEATGCMVYRWALVLSALISAIYHWFHRILGISWLADQLWLIKIDSEPLELVT